jgi:hypothetical protein
MHDLDLAKLVILSAMWRSHEQFLPAVDIEPVEKPAAAELRRCINADGQQTKNRPAFVPWPGALCSSETRARRVAAER